MPSSPLIDLDQIDLSQTVATRAEILTVLKQRGPFAMLDAIVHRGTEPELIVGYKDIRSDDWWADAHIPGRPIFPGALMIETSAQLCAYDYLVRMPKADERFVGFGGLNATRFRGLVEPTARMYFVGKPNRIRSGMFIYFAQGFVEGRMVFETEVMGVAL